VTATPRFLRSSLRFRDFMTLVLYRRYAEGMQSARDHQLIQIVDAAMAEAARKGGDWVVCRPGCCECCIGVFPIAQSDVRRLRDGLRELERTDPARAANVSRRSREAAARYTVDFPGDAATGILGDDPESEDRFESFADDDPCPALDPETGTCDLYAWRPMTCRTFGAAVRLNEDSVDICELCYRGAADEEIVACEVDLQTAELEAALENEAEASTGLTGQTIVAFALR
jgi:Fe-S-cluster containining protein